MTEVQNDFFEEKEFDQTTLTEFEQLCEKAFLQRERIDQVKKELDGEKKTLEEMETKIASILEAHERDSFQSSRGTVYFHETSSFKLPEGPENKALFYNHLKSKGVFEGLVSVHSKTLNTYCRIELEAAVGEGNVTYKIPGIGEPVIIKDIRFRKGK